MYDEQKSESSLWASISLKQSNAFCGEIFLKKVTKRKKKLAIRVCLRETLAMLRLLGESSSNNKGF